MAFGYCLCLITQGKIKSGRLLFLVTSCLDLNFRLDNFYWIILSLKRIEVLLWYDSTITDGFLQQAYLANVNSAPRLSGIRTLEDPRRKYLNK